MMKCVYKDQFGFVPRRRSNEKSNYQGLFAKLCKSQNHCKSRTTVNIVTDNVHIDNCTYVGPENSWSNSQEVAGLINARNNNGQSYDDDKSVLSVRITYDANGLETMKPRLGWEMILHKIFLQILSAQ